MSHVVAKESFAAYAAHCVLDFTTVFSRGYILAPLRG